MGELEFWDYVRDWIGSIGFKVFLWSVRMTATQYLDAIEATRECELRRKVAAL